VIALRPAATRGLDRRRDLELQRGRARTSPGGSGAAAGLEARAARRARAATSPSSSPPPTRSTRLSSRCTRVVARIAARDGDSTDCPAMLSTRSCARAARRQPRPPPSTLALTASPTGPAPAVVELRGRAAGLTAPVAGLRSPAAADDYREPSSARHSARGHSAPRPRDPQPARPRCTPRRRRGIRSIEVRSPVLSQACRFPAAISGTVGRQPVGDSRLCLATAPALVRASAVRCGDGSQQS